MKRFFTYSILTIAFLALGGAAIVNAQSSDSGQYPTIIQRLVEKFNLNSDDVQQVFDEIREENQVAMQNRMEERIQSVNNLTDEQKTAISEKTEEMRQSFQDLKDLTPEEKKAVMEQNKADLETWAEENGIDSELLTSGHMFKFFPGGDHERGGMRMGFPMGNNKIEGSETLED